MGEMSNPWSYPGQPGRGIVGVYNDRCIMQYIIQLHESHVLIYYSSQHAGHGYHSLSLIACTTGKELCEQLNERQWRS